jgi:small multidrug resistance family-3 protein
MMKVVQTLHYHPSPVCHPKENLLMFLMQTAGLFILTALAEIIGCFLPYLWLRKDGSIWLLVPAALSLAVFSWLLTLHPAASGRVYAAYGGVYVATALVWLKVVDGEDLSIFDWTGAGIALLGMGVIVFGWSAKE